MVEIGKTSQKQDDRNTTGLNFTFVCGYKKGYPIPLYYINRTIRWWFVASDAFSDYCLNPLSMQRTFVIALLLVVAAGSHLFVNAQTMAGKKQLLPNPEMLFLFLVTATGTTSSDSPGKFRVWRRPTWTVRYHGIWDTNEFYDLQHDPYEMNNLIASPEHQKTIGQMANEVYDWLEKSNSMEIPLKRTINISTATTCIRSSIKGQ